MDASRILNEQLVIPKSTALVVGLRHVAAWPEVLAFVYQVQGTLTRKARENRERLRRSGRLKNLELGLEGN